MKAALFTAVLGSLRHGAVGAETESNPIGKVIEFIDDLAAKVTKEGEAETKAYAEYLEWCDGAAKNAQFAVEDATKEKEQLEALIDELTSNAAVADGKIEDLTAAVATSEKDLKAAAAIRAKELEDFKAGEKELMDTVDTVGRAIGVLQKELAKNPAALAQVDATRADRALQALSVVLDAAAFASNDQHKLQSLLQAQQESTDDDAAPGAPAAAAYKSHSGGIIDVLEDMKDKAEGQLSDLRKAESKTKHNYEMLRSSLEAQRDADNKDLVRQKAAKAEAEEDKATAEGDLERTVQSLATSSKELATSRSTCMTVAADHEATVAARDEELKVIAEARKILVESSSGAVSQTYSFVQLHLQSHAALAQSEVIATVRDLARKHHSSALAQLASRIAAEAKYGASNGDNVFGKITGLIRDMIAKLEKEAEEEATEKAYCDEETANTEAKKGELEDDVARLTSKIDQDAAKSAHLKEEVRTLEGELAALAKEQAEMDKIRQETHADYEVAKADLESGLGGVRKALRLLRDYYGGGAALLQDDAQFGAFMQQPAAPEHHSKSGGAGQSIINILEVCESDFAKNLAKEEQEESDAQSTYETTTQENKIAKSSKEQDVKYKTQEATSLDTTISELSSDRQTANTELSAVLEYYDKIKERCVKEPETYEERKARRDAEIEGLKQALTILNEETAFVQRKHRHMRGSVISARSLP